MLMGVDIYKIRVYYSSTVSTVFFREVFHMLSALNSLLMQSLILCFKSSYLDIIEIDILYTVAEKNLIYT